VWQFKNDIKKDIFKDVSSFRNEFANTMSEVKHKRNELSTRKWKFLKWIPYSKRYSLAVVAIAEGIRMWHLLVYKWTASTRTGRWLHLLLAPGSITLTLWRTDVQVMCHVMIKWTKCLLHLKITKVQNSPRPYFKYKLNPTQIKVVPSKQWRIASYTLSQIGKEN
jgi:hypothetical protein